MKLKLRPVLLLAVLALVMMNVVAQNPRATEPVIIGPANGSTVNTYSPLVEWTDNGATSYKVVIKNAAGTKVVKANVTPAEACEIGGNCYVSPVEQGVELLNGTHTWSVIAIDEAGKAKSEVYSFIVDFPGEPVLMSPANGSTVAPDPVLEWEVGNDAFQYKIKIKDTTAGEVVLKTAWLDAFELCLETCTYATSLPDGSYSWQVKARYEDPIYSSKSVKNAFTVTAVE